MSDWFKVAVSIYDNGKIRAAAPTDVRKQRDVRDVWIYVLAVHRRVRGDGRIASTDVGRYLSPPLVAAKVGMSPEEAADALDACRQVELMTWERDGSIVIVGWDEEWKAQTSAERTRRWRERRADVTSHGAGCDVTSRGHVTSQGARAGDVTVTSPRDDVTGCDVTNAGNVTSPAVTSSHVTSPPLSESFSGSGSGDPEAKKDVGATGQASLPGMPSEPPVARRRGKESPLDYFRALAASLWEEQEALRTSVVPRTRRRVATDADLELVADRLAEGRTAEDCRHVLRVYAAEARKDPEAARWFNGETNWRPANFGRALGQPDPGNAAKPTGKASPYAQNAIARILASEGGR